MINMRGGVMQMFCQDPQGSFLCNTCFVQSQFVRLQDPPWLLMSNKSDSLVQYAAYKNVRERTKTLLRILIPATPPQLSYSRSIGVTYEFFKRSMIPWVDSDINFRVNIFAISNMLDALQDNRLKTITCLEFHFRNSMPSSSTARVKTKIPYLAIC